MAPLAATDEYLFTVTDGSYELLGTYQSREEENLRDGQRSCGRAGSDSNDGCWSGTWETDPTPAYHTYTPGETYPCWAPTAGKNRDNLPSVYKCGDGASPAGDACVKLWDPQTEADAADDAATGMLTGGIILLVLAILGGSIFAFCFNLEKKDEKDEKDEKDKKDKKDKKDRAESERRRQQATAQPAVQMAAAQPMAFSTQPAMPVAQAQLVQGQPMAVAVAKM